MGRLAGVVVLVLAASLALFPAQVQNVSLETGVAGAQEGPPAAPSELTANPYIPDWSVVILFWRDNANKEDAYRIERSEGGEDGPWVLVAETTKACPGLLQDERQCGYAARNLVPETTYWFRVAAVNEAGVSAYSNSAMTVTASRRVPEPGAIRGVVFHDRNGDGDRDTGENIVKGVRHVTLMQDGEVVDTSVFRDGGSYAFWGLTPGDYTVASDLDDYRPESCEGFEFSYDPLQRLSCSQTVLPWNPTSPNPVAVSLDGDGGAVVDFGAEPADVMVVAGDALLETGHAPMGTVITALVKGQECGTTTVVGGKYDDFSIYILGAGEREGCALPGDQVQFTVGGLLAGNSIRWKPLYDPSRVLNLGLIVPHRGDIVAMQDHAWYWFERSGDRPIPDGTLVQAMIDGVVCGEARVESLASESIAGFSQLLVSSSDVAEGCGREGSTVSFQVNGLRATTQVLWELRLRRLFLVLHGDPDCDFDVDALDAQFVLQGVAGLAGWLSCGDPNALPDWSIDARDALLILQLDAGLIEQLPVTSRPWPWPIP